MRRPALVFLAVFAVQSFLVAQTANSQPNVTTQAAVASSPESARQHLTRVFAEVAAENRGTDKARSRYFSSSYSFYFHFPTWSLHDGNGPSLRKSLALDALSIEFNAPGPAQSERARVFVQTAATMLEDSNPKRRALAAELLAMMPIHTLESGAIEKLAPLLDDNAVAWVGVGLGGAQWAQAADVGPLNVTVAQVASSAINSLTPFQFREAKTLRRWWEANNDVRAHPWYWSVRWRTTPAEKDLASLDSLEIDQGLRMLLLASNNHALLADARQSAGPQLDFGGTVADSSVATALFVHRHGISNKLLDVVEGKIPWGGEVVPDAKAQLARTAVGVLNHTIAPRDLPRLKQLLQTPKGELATDETLLLSLTRVAMRWLPADHEKIVVSLVEANPGRQLIALELLEETGIKHWELIKRSYVTPPTNHSTDSRYGMIRSAPLVTDNRGKQCLAELFALDDLEIVPPNQDDAQRLRFEGFVEAVNMHSRDEVVSTGELDGAIYRHGKGGDRRPEEIIAAVAENRRAVLKKLRKYLSGEK